MIDGDKKKEKSKDEKTRYIWYTPSFVTPAGTFRGRASISIRVCAPEEEKAE